MFVIRILKTTLELEVDPNLHEYGTDYTSQGKSCMTGYFENIRNNELYLNRFNMKTI